MDIANFHNCCIHHVQRVTDEVEQIPTLAIVLNGKGEIIVLSRQFDGYEDKSFMFDMYAIILALEEATMYCFVSETWFCAREEGSNTNILPSEQSDRKEGLIFITTKKGNSEQYHHMFEIIRSNGRKQLIDSGLNHVSSDKFDDNIDLFNRLSPTKLEKLANRLISLHEIIGKPTWYNKIDKEHFIDVKVDS